LLDFSAKRRFAAVGQDGRDRSYGKKAARDGLLAVFLLSGAIMPQMDKSTEELVLVTRWLRQHKPASYAALRERLRDLMGDYFAYVEPCHTRLIELAHHDERPGQALVPPSTVRLAPVM
jgi:hypothetical protein